MKTTMKHFSGVKSELIESIPAEYCWINERSEDVIFQVDDYLDYEGAKQEIIDIIFDCNADYVRLTF